MTTSVIVMYIIAYILLGLFTVYKTWEDDDDTGASIVFFFFWPVVMLTLLLATIFGDWDRIFGTEETITDKYYDRNLNRISKDCYMNSHDNFVTHKYVNTETKNIIKYADERIDGLRNNLKTGFDYAKLVEKNLTPKIENLEWEFKAKSEVLKQKVEMLENPCKFKDGDTVYLIKPHLQVEEAIVSGIRWISEDKDWSIILCYGFGTFSTIGYKSKDLFTKKEYKKFKKNLNK